MNVYILIICIEYPDDFEIETEVFYDLGKARTREEEIMKTSDFVIYTKIEQKTI